MAQELDCGSARHWSFRHSGQKKGIRAQFQTLSFKASYNEVTTRCLPALLSGRKHWPSKWGACPEPASECREAQPSCPLSVLSEPFFSNGNTGHWGGITLKTAFPLPTLPIPNPHKTLTVNPLLDLGKANMLYNRKNQPLGNWHYKAIGVLSFIINPILCNTNINSKHLLHTHIKCIHFTWMLMFIFSFTPYNNPVRKLLFSSF